MPPKRVARKRSIKVIEEEGEEDEVENVAPEHEARKLQIEKALGDSEKEEEKGGFEGHIEPDSKFTYPGCHVLVEDGIIYDATLNQTNIANNNNKFYILQVLKHDTQDCYWCLFRWGRVGYDGQQSISEGSAASMKNAFKKKFKDKTGNEFDNRDNFVRKAKKYDLIQIDHAKKALPTALDGIKEDQDHPSELDPRLKAVIDTICSIRAMEVYLKRQMNYDTDKNPLGRITKAQIKEGYQILTKMEDHLLKEEIDEDYTELVSSYLTKIPHAYGMKRPTELLETLDEIKDELALLEALANAEVANSLLSAASSAKVMNPADQNYSRLKCEMIALEVKDPHYKIVETYLKNTHGATHSDFKMNLVNVFKLERKGEIAGFRKDLDNHRLLWHGSPLPNWVGILLKGLRIAPSEAPVTGYMFGKGIYFADSCSKSGNYCHARVGDKGFLALSQVALGNMQEKIEDDYEADLKRPADVHSTFGMGMNEPVKKGSKKIKFDGIDVHVPCGTLATKENADDFELLYNEFIVYDPKQTVLRFLVEVEFVAP